MRTIAIDVMGNDFGPKPMIDAVLDFLKSNINYKAIFVGDKSLITTLVKENEKIEILDAPNFVPPTAKAFAARDFTTSMAQAITLVKQGRADAVLSAGSSAAYLSNAVLILGRLPGVVRPAFLSVFPSIKKDKRFVMLDCGANTFASGATIAQWAKLGSVFVDVVLDIEKPVIAMLNVGTEENKGLPFHQEAHAILKNDLSMNYVGFIESKSLLDSGVDVVIADGYGGNITLKTMEGVVFALIKTMKNNLTSSLWRKILARMLKGAIKESFEAFDYRNVGAACVIGVDGLVIKSHGSSDRKAFNGALRQMKTQIEKQFIDRLRKEKI